MHKKYTLTTKSYKKSLIDKLQEQRSKKEPAHKGVVAVLAHRKEISEALESGFTMREIHTVMLGERTMPISYAGFTRLVNKYIKGKENGKQKTATSTESKSTVYNPDDYNMEDLY